jgi:hypothetical protein
MKHEIILKDGCWVIGSNRWIASMITKERAEYYATTLVDCYNCTNCSDCNSCSYCNSCSDLSHCRHCSFSRYCSDCTFCIGCGYCSECEQCSYCHHCSFSRHCSHCEQCSHCSFCEQCSGFKTNPKRITSPNLGKASRNSQTTYYWNTEREQVWCWVGQFKGTLEEFETNVKETHGDNVVAKEYCKWIQAVKNLLA